MPLFKTRLVPLLLLFTAMAVRAGEVQVELSGLQDAAGDLAVDGQRVLDQVVGADGEKIEPFGKGICCKCCSSTLSRLRILLIFSWVSGTPGPGLSDWTSSYREGMRPL